ncbi:hypothetical protein GCM10010289_58430 [Streptomyces violascens]|nr:hypothetical protein GCM10010289_58430 [Streptomyces violascens]
MFSRQTTRTAQPGAPSGLVAVHVAVQNPAEFPEPHPDAAEYARELWATAHKYDGIDWDKTGARPEVNLARDRYPPQFGGQLSVDRVANYESSQLPDRWRSDQHWPAIGRSHSADS